MKFVKGIAASFGLLMILMGGLWIGQGLNIIRWPADSFMLGEPKWSWNGLGLAMLGSLLIWWWRKR